MRQEHKINNRISRLQARCEIQNKQKNNDEGIWYRIQELWSVIETYNSDDRRV